jgi:predicted DNA binding protein
MPQATLKLKSNEALVALSERHPNAEFSVRGAWPANGKLRVLIETSTVALPALKKTLSAVPTLTKAEIRSETEERFLFEVSTPTPAPHGAMADSGVVPSYPLHIEDGWFVGDLTASQEQLSAFRDELDTAGIEYQIVSVSETESSANMLTARQQEVVELAIEHGYYESPRQCTLMDLADVLDVNKSVVCRILQRAEGHIITAYYATD